VPRVHLFRWYRHAQLDIELLGGWMSLGVKRWRPIAYWSPDATPMHPKARGWGAR
jgi:hypothetical protein